MGDRVDRGISLVALLFGEAEAAPYECPASMSGPGIWWSGLRVKRPGSLVQGLADERVGREALHCLEAPCKVAGGNEVREMSTKPAVDFRSRSV